MWKKVVLSVPVLWVFTLALPRTARAELVGWWPFDETSGATVADSSANGNHGVLINGPTWAEGRVNGALRLDGTNDYVELPKLRCVTSRAIDRTVQDRASGIGMP